MRNPFISVFYDPRNKQTRPDCMDTRKTLSDWWWMRGNQSKYVCPLLMTLSLYVCRLKGQRANWYEKDGRHSVLIRGKKSYWEMPCAFPKGAILTEHRCREWVRRRRHAVKRA